MSSAKAPLEPDLDRNHINTKKQEQILHTNSTHQRAGSPAIAGMPERVVFMNQTAVKTNLTRLRGWAPQGERLTVDAPFETWGTQTLIAGLTRNALITPWVIKGAMDGTAFAADIREVRVKKIAPSTVVILDNMATHQNKKTTDPA